VLQSGTALPLDRLASFAAVLVDLAIVSAVGAEGAPAVRGALDHLALRTPRPRVLSVRRS